MADDYRGLVGPAKLYDEIGALQFFLLFSLGMRSQHTLCDIGCGVLRLGRLAIPYLAEGNYCGLEPDYNKVVAGVTHELGYSETAIGDDTSEAGLLRRPLFNYNAQYDLTVFNCTFDYIIAHSIFTHAPQQQIELCFDSVAQTLKREGVFAFTFFQGGRDYDGAAWANKARYRAAYFRGLAEARGLRSREIAWYHPKGQRWILVHRTGVPVQPLMFECKRRA